MRYELTIHASEILGQASVLVQLKRTGPDGSFDPERVLRRLMYVEIEPETEPDVWVRDLLVGILEQS